MRLDLFLRNSGLVPRRPVAKRACDEGRVEINDRAAKPGAAVRVGDQVTLRLGMTVSRHEVLGLPPRPVPRAKRDECVRLISTDKVDWDT